MAQQDTDQIFREVDEELRREQLAKIWQQYGTYILGAAALIVIGVGGWKWLEARRVTQIEAASIKYDAANQLATDGKADDAQAALALIAKSGPEGYALLAKLRLAAAAVPNPREKVTPTVLNPEEFKNDPLIKQALEIFKGQIVEVRG